MMPMNRCSFDGESSVSPSEKQADISLKLMKPKRAAVSGSFQQPHRESQELGEGPVVVALTKCNKPSANNEHNLKRRAVKELKSLLSKMPQPSNALRLRPRCNLSKNPFLVTSDDTATQRPNDSPSFTSPTSHLNRMSTDTIAHFPQSLHTPRDCIERVAPTTSPPPCFFSRRVNVGESVAGIALLPDLM